MESCVTNVQSHCNYCGERVRLKAVWVWWCSVLHRGLLLLSEMFPLICSETTSENISAFQDHSLCEVALICTRKARRFLQRSAFHGRAAVRLFFGAFDWRLLTPEAAVLCPPCYVDAVVLGSAFCKSLIQSHCIQHKAIIKAASDVVHLQEEALFGAAATGLFTQHRLWIRGSDRGRRVACSLTRRCLFFCQQVEWN